MPTGWLNIPINDKNPRAQYWLVNQSGAKVLHARAERAARMLLNDQRIDLGTQPIVHWKWRMGTAPAHADIAVASKEDSAARLVFLFDGDVHRLPLVDRLTQSLGSELSGRVMPYATLMYVSSERCPQKPWVVFQAELAANRSHAEPAAGRPWGRVAFPWLQRQ